MPVGSNSEESTGRSHRGGIPASRAQRLAETVQKGPGLPFFSHFVILACVLCIMTVIGFGLGANFGYLGHQVAVPSVEAAPSLKRIRTEPPIGSLSDLSLYLSVLTEPGHASLSR